MAKGKNTKKKIGENVEREDLSFIDKVKTDKKYSAKVQLIGYGVLIVALVLYLNISSISNSNNIGNTIIPNVDENSAVDENTSMDKTSLLEQLGNNNYRYDVSVDVEREVNDTDKDETEDVMIRYYGRVYEDTTEINREDMSGKNLYYKVDDNYYNKLDNDMKLMDEDDIYFLIDSEYIEISSILKLIEKASLDHVTDYSSGKKEYVYHLKVRDVVVSYKMEDVVEIEIEEENGILKIEIDYSNLLKVVNEDIVECDLEATVTEIGKIEEFLNLEENAS